MMAWYGRRLRHEQQVVGDGLLAVVVAVGVLGVWKGHVGAIVGSVVVLVVWRRAAAAAAALALGLVGSHLAAGAWAGVQPDQLGPVRTWATVIGDPEPIGRATRVILEIDGERFRTQVYTRERRSLAVLEAGERVEVVGTRRPLQGRFTRSAQVRHLVGDFDLEWAGDVVPAGGVDRAANRVRAAVRMAADRTLDDRTAALFTGLVIGDDSRQSRPAIEQFRSAGLSHLTAVSGQNVAFVIAIAGLVLRRLPTPWRAGATLAVIAWFVVLTRAEPSIVRAGVMAGWGTLATALGRPIPPARSLCLAVGVLIVVDPLLVWSVGFWLSVGATAGVCVVGPWLESVIGGPRWLASAVAVTVGAQIGVVLPSVLVFGALPALGVFANLLAVPVAGMVMLVGLPGSMVAAAAPIWLADLAMLPAEVGTRWVATVAALVARFEPSGAQAIAVWLVQLWLFALLAREGWRDRPAAVER